jgi:hypothetical protein
MNVLDFFSYVHYPRLPNVQVSGVSFDPRLVFPTLEMCVRQKTLSEGGHGLEDGKSQVVRCLRTSSVH